VAMALIHGENTPREALRRIGRGGGTATGYEGLFNETWPHRGVLSQQVLRFLPPGRAGERARHLRLDILPSLIRGEEDSRTPDTGGGPGIDLGSRSKEHTVREHGNAEVGRGTLKVLWTIGGLPASAWQDEEFRATLRAWALPDEHEEYCALVGVEPEPKTPTEPEQPQTSQAPQNPQVPERPSGLFGRLFGRGH